VPVATATDDSTAPSPSAIVTLQCPIGVAAVMAMMEAIKETASVMMAGPKVADTSLVADTVDNTAATAATPTVATALVETGATVGDTLPVGINLNEETLGKWNVLQLKTKIKKRDLHCTGKKAELVNPLMHPTEKDVWHLLKKQKKKTAVKTRSGKEARTKVNIEKQKDKTSSMKCFPLLAYWKPLVPSSIAVEPENANFCSPRAPRIAKDKDKL